MKFEFVDEMEKGAYHARIKVLGIGGAGGNAISNMINSDLRGVEFIVANTDCQDLERSSCTRKIQLGPEITMGLGAGADPEIGRNAAEESLHEIRESLDQSDMVFITAGMGGGTGTGASPVAAREGKANNALTVAVVTKPFKFEGDKRMKQALEGIEQLKKEVDSIIVIPNERLKTIGDKTTTFKELIAKADDVLLQAVKGISDLIMSSGFINLDFADVRKVMSRNGTAIMGMGRASGETRAVDAAQEAINSPLLEDISIEGAKGLLMNLTGPSDMTMEEVDEASSYIKEEAKGAEVFWGLVYDDNMGDEIQVTVVATGIDSFEEENAVGRVIELTSEIQNKSIEEYDNVVNLRNVTIEDIEEEWTVKKDGISLDIPTFQRWESKDENDFEKKGEGEKKKSFFDKFRIKDGLDYPTFLRVKAD
ncbi:MAG: cell division protein FtsZ [Deltaproteobacteria bacterium]|nr:cell division protein FtsZ [Deltaproteobacteria bacterium]